MFQKLLLALKNQVCPEFTVLNVFFTLQNFEQLALALKIFTALDIVFTFRIFEQLVLALKNRVCREFTVLNIYVFYHSEF